MSDYDDSRCDTSDEEEEEVVNRGSGESEENNERELQQYNSDGLTNDEYKSASILRGQLVQAECCNKFFSQEGYAHKVKYGLNFQGVNTCIHCYFRLNDYKLLENSDITQKEIECLKYYINNFVEEHQPSKCNGTICGGKCVLCDAIRGVYPSIIAKDMIAIDEIVNDDSITCTSFSVGNNDDIYNDIRVIKQNSISDSKNIKKDQNRPFILIL